MFVDGAAGPQVPLEESGLDFDGHVTIGGAEWDPFDGRLDDDEHMESSVDSSGGETLDGGRNVLVF